MNPDHMNAMLTILSWASHQGFRIKRWRMTESQALDAAIQSNRMMDGSRTIAERYAGIKEGRIPFFGYPVEMRP